MSRHWVLLSLSVLSAACVSTRQPASHENCTDATTRILEKLSTQLDAGPLHSKYTFQEGWLQFSPDPLALPRQGFKMHISYRSPDEVAVIFKAIAPYLVEQKIPHKVSGLKNLPELVGTQRGKAITIWTSDPQEVQRVAQEIDSILSRLSLQRQMSIRIEGEREIFPGIFVRYGQIHAMDDLPGFIYRSDPTGTFVVSESGDPILWKGQPMRVNEPLSKMSFNDLEERRAILLNSGAIVKDQRGTYKPDWIADPF